MLVITGIHETRKGEGPELLVLGWEGHPQKIKETSLSVVFSSKYTATCVSHHVPKKVPRQEQRVSRENTRIEREKKENVHHVIPNREL